MEKRFANGLVLGKFMPLHNGHLHLINTAIEQCDVLYIMICSLDTEPINGSLRWSWLKMIYNNNKNVVIIHCEDENPQKPEEADSVDSFYNDYWVPSVYNRIQQLDVVFTSEDYGDEFAKYLNVQHVLVDLDRVTHPVSGTAIRNNPFANWEYIPNDVKSFFTKRIAVMGPESTGKSTLVKKLVNHYGVDHIEEYGRTYTETIKPALELDAEDFYKIADTHNDMLLDKHEETLGKLLFADTEAITTKMFGEMYLKDYKDERLDEIIKHQWFDLYLVMDIDVPWVNDGTRDFSRDEDRKRHFNKIKAELDKLGKNYVVISGHYDERFEKSKKEIEKLGYL
jgi:HTH-type transcriptional repressor of NAD biosynthesis genes